MSFRSVTHCIFDLDGTLVDSEKIYFKAIDSVLCQFGHRHSLELCRKITGTTEMDYSRIIVEHCNLPISREEFLKQMKEKAQSMLGTVALMPGVKRLVEHLKKNNIPMAIGTSSSLQSVQLKLSSHEELRNCFEHVVSGSDDVEVLAGKPAPDVFLVCAKRFNPAPDPRNVLVFEDSLNGVLSGLAAGMQVVMVPDPQTVTEEARKIPTLCLDSLEDFSPELFGLPSF